MTISRTLYHFTRCEGANAIIASGTMRFSEVRSLNDDTEISYGQSLFREPILGWIQQNFSDDRYKEFFSNFTDFRFKFEKVGNSIFSASFCTKINNNKLWNDYADIGRGVAIGFDENAFYKMGHVRPVRYPTQGADEFIERRLKLFDSMFAHIKALPWGQILPEDINRMFVEIMASYVCTKEVKWKDEREIRIVWMQAKSGHQHYDSESRQRNGEKRYLPVEKRIVDGKEVDFITRNFKERSAYLNPIREVLLGWDCPISPQEMGAFLDGHGYNVARIVKMANPMISPNNPINSVWQH